MSNWLDVVREALDDSSEPVKIFFRDDDAGWANSHLCRLLDEFAKAQLPIDLAIIPHALEQKLADELLSRQQQNKQLLGLHQHGYAHVNHETDGRKCEFGTSRNKLQQKNDIDSGQQLLHAFLGDALDSFFHPTLESMYEISVSVWKNLNLSSCQEMKRHKNLNPQVCKKCPFMSIGTNFLKPQLMC